jgi:Holliday junction DNA helicase RuvA
MFYYIKGALALLNPGLAVLEAGGIGYKLTISEHTYQALAGKKEAKLFTHLAVREDGVELFGFHAENELDTFLLLTGVSGVGPKAAMAILSRFTPDQFVLAVCTEDKKSIAKANGIGPKIAARVILELHDKLASGTAMPDLGGAELPATAPAAGTPGALRDAQEALLVLGYNRTQILTALQGVDTNGMSSEDIIRAALKKLM